MLKKLRVKFIALNMATVAVVLAVVSVSYTHLRAHETGRNLVCRLLLEKKKKNIA